jgi:mersacidin/lichenicidin family type 2 lantibiotic
MVNVYFDKEYIMQEVDVVRAWKDAAYRTELSADQLAALPQNPVGELEFDLTDAELALIGGGEADFELTVETIKPRPPIPQSFLPEVCKSYILGCKTFELTCNTVPREVCDPAQSIDNIVCRTINFEGRQCWVLDDSNVIL